jgi:hypothetical protein
VFLEGLDAPEGTAAVDPELLDDQVDERFEGVSEGGSGPACGP